MLQGLSAAWKGELIKHELNKQEMQLVLEVVGPQQVDMHEQQQSQQHQLKHNAEPEKPLLQAPQQPLQRHPLQEEHPEVDGHEKKKSRKERIGKKQRENANKDLTATEEQQQAQQEPESLPVPEQLLQDAKQQQLEQQEAQQHDAEENSCPQQEDPAAKSLERGNQLQACQQQPHQLHPLPSAEAVSAQRHDAVTHRKGAKFRPILVGDVLCKNTPVYCIADKLPGCPVYGRIISDVPLVSASNAAFGI